MPEGIPSFAKILSMIRRGLFALHSSVSVVVCAEIDKTVPKPHIVDIRLTRKTAVKSEILPYSCRDLKVPELGHRNCDHP
jgi:hypothetical protein